MSNVNVSVQNGNNISLEVTPTPQQTITISRGSVGPAGPNTIGGYPISISSAQNFDALMFQSNQWVNIPQTEIADGGNF